LIDSRDTLLVSGETANALGSNSCLAEIYVVLFMRSMVVLVACSYVINGLNEMKETPLSHCFSLEKKINSLFEY